MANISTIKVGSTSYGITATPTAHASTATTYGAASASNYGHVKLSDNYTSSAGAAASGIGASSAAVYNAYNTLNSNLTNIDFTNATIVSSSYYKINTAVSYKVKNGICFVYVNGLYVNTVADSWQIIASGLPKAVDTWVTSIPYFGTDSKPPIVVEKGVNEYLRIAFGGPACGYNFTFSYPIS